MKQKLRILSYAKVNLLLKVRNKRADGYHNLFTIFEHINLADIIDLKLNPSGEIRIICKQPEVPLDKTNLCLKAAQLLKDYGKVKSGVQITIKKNIPVAAGLGGGSSNAAATLMGCNKLWGLNLSRKKLVFLAKKIGCDVPFFVYQTPFAAACARGDAILPLLKLKSKRFWHILAVPRIHVSTPKIFRSWDKNPVLTTGSPNVKILTSALLKSDYIRLSSLLKNSLEPVTVKLYPQVGKICARLKARGLKTVLMSGSGPSVFGLVSGSAEAKRHLLALRKDAGIRVFIVRTV